MEWLVHPAFFGEILSCLAIWSWAVSWGSMVCWLSYQIFMVGRYVVELMLILMCGLGLHTTEVTLLGGAEVFVRFDKVSIPRCQGRYHRIVPMDWADRFSSHMLVIFYGSQLWPWSICHFYITTSANFSIESLCGWHIPLWLSVQRSGLEAYLQLHFSAHQRGSSGWRISPVTAVIAKCYTWAPLWARPFSRRLFSACPFQSYHICNSRKRERYQWGSCTSSVLCENPRPYLWKPRKSNIIFDSIITATAIRIKVEFDLDPDDEIFGSARKSLLSCIVPLLGILVACFPILAPSIQRIFGTTMFSPSDGETYGYRSSGYYKTTVISGTQMEGPEIPLVTVTQPPMAKKLSEWCHGQIKITSDWEIHSARNSARIDKDSIRRAWDGRLCPFNDFMTMN